MANFAKACPSVFMCVCVCVSVNTGGKWEDPDHYYLKYFAGINKTLELGNKYFQAKKKKKSVN